MKRLVGKFKGSKASPVRSQLLEDLVLRLHQDVIMSDPAPFEETLRRVKEYVQNSKGLTLAEVISTVPPSDERGMSLLLRALEDCHFSRAKALIDGGIVTNSISTDTRQCALHFLISSIPARLKETPEEGYQEAWEEIVFLLSACAEEPTGSIAGSPASARRATRGVGVNWPDLFRRTPLHLAAELGLGNVVKWLLNNGAEPSPVGSKRQTPLYMAAAAGHVEIAKVLLRSGASTVLEVSLQCAAWNALMRPLKC